MAGRGYQALSQDERDDIIVAFHLAQERDHFCHELNRQRYTAILPALGAQDPFRARITQLLTETDARLAEVEVILTKTETQLPQDATKRAAALARVRAKEQATR